MKTAQDNSEVQHYVETFVEDHTTCCLCGTELKFDFNIDHTQNKVLEQAACPCCHVQMKQKEHNLQ